MSSSLPATVVLSAFQPAGAARTDTTELPAVRPAVRHPEAASTSCQCSAPEPCWTHQPAPPDLPRVEAAVYVPPVVAGMTAPTVCQCIAPEPCRVHPPDRPWIKRPPACSLSRPNGTVGRLDRRPEPGGPVLEIEARARLPKFTDDDVAMLVRLVSAEQRRRGLHLGGRTS